MVLNSKFDSVRKYIRQPFKHEKWDYAQVIASSEKIRCEMGAYRIPDAPGESILLRIFSDDFYVDLLNTGKLYYWLQSKLVNKILIRRTEEGT